MLNQDPFASIDCLIDCDYLWPVMLQWRPHYHTVSGYSDTVPLVHLFASQHF